MKFGRAIHYLMTKNPCLGPDEITCGKNILGDDCSNLKVVAFVAKIACEGGPKTISTCLEMITVISLSFCHISER